MTTRAPAVPIILWTWVRIWEGIRLLLLGTFFKFYRSDILQIRHHLILKEKNTIKVVSKRVENQDMGNIELLYIIKVHAFI